MTELLTGRGGTFPRSLLDTFRCNRNEYSELKASKSDELILQNPTDIPISCEIQHGRSENLLNTDETEDDLQNLEILRPNTCRKSKRISIYDKVDPEDSIRDIVNDNDFYKFILFKKHYDKYLYLSEKYEEAKHIAFYLDEKYQELKHEKDELLLKKQELTERLETCERALCGKEDEVFVQFERIVYLEEQCNKLLKQAEQSEQTIKKLEGARYEIIQHMTELKDEKECLEKENDNLKEILETERAGMKTYISDLKKRKKEEDKSATLLTSQFQKAVQHLVSCKRKKCSVCNYTRMVYAKNAATKHKDKKLLNCLQTPFLEMRNMIRPPPSPIHGNASLSEWFCNLDGNDDDDDDNSSMASSECCSLNIPFREMAISYIDDSSEDTFSFEQQREQSSLSHLGGVSRFESDSGFSSDIICSSNTGMVSTPKKECFMRKQAGLDESECAKLTRTKWTASFRKLIKRIRK